MVMIVWLTAAYKKLDIRSNLVINFDCAMAQNSLHIYAESCHW